MERMEKKASEGRSYQKAASSPRASLNKPKRERIGLFGCDVQG